MKSKIHPKYYKNAKVTCACGNTYTTGSTLPEINVDICAACHPFYTGEMKLVDTQGRIEKFKLRKQKALKNPKKKKKKTQTNKQQPSSLKEMLQKKSSSSKKAKKS